MQTQTRRPVRPTTPADLWRLADQARTNGVQLFTEAATGARFATSATEPGTVYYVTGMSCTCRGFTHHQRCQHHSLLLAELGWLPDPAPAPALVGSCSMCGGRGIDPDCAGHPVAGMVVHCPCPRCQGTGTASVAVVMAA
ncbi:MAG: hypothetical protein M3R02_19020 [Chloroflexota bacterium]|nr:hypothetical protein [Chloroflexota bacterium]